MLRDVDAKEEPGRLSRKVVQDSKTDLLPKLSDVMTAQVHAVAKSTNSQGARSCNYFFRAVERHLVVN